MKKILIFLIILATFSQVQFVEYAQALDNSDNKNSFVESLQYYLKNVMAVGKSTPKVDCNSLINNTNSNVEAFCKDPYATICSDIDYHRDTQKNRLKKNSNSASEAIKEFQNNYEITKILESVKEMLNLAIDQTSINEDKKKEFKNVVKKSNVIFSNQIAEKLQKKHVNGEKISAEEMELYKQITMSCSDLTPVAFAYDVKKGERNTDSATLVICEGAILAGVKEGEKPNPDNFIKRNLGILFHEISHFYSPRWEIESYQTYRTCLKQNDGEKILKDYREALKKNGDNLKISKEEESKYIDWLIGAHLDEVTCDHFAAQSVANYLQSKYPHDPDKVLEFIKGSYGYFCGTDDKVSHPSGRYRIEMIARHPQVLKLMNCSISSSIVLSCSP